MALFIGIDWMENVVSCNGLVDIGNAVVLKPLPAPLRVLCPRRDDWGVGCMTGYDH
jgi:hypothetical protein